MGMRACGLGLGFKEVDGRGLPSLGLRLGEMCDVLYTHFVGLGGGMLV